MATNDKIVIIKGSSVLQVTNPTGATFLGYKTVNGEKQTIQVDFSNMTPLFGVSQTVGNSTTLAPSEKAVKNAIKAILTDSTMLASNTQNGLITIDQYKSIEDMITNFQGLLDKQEAIKNEIKRIADTQSKGTDEAYTTTINVFHVNSEPRILPQYFRSQPIVGASKVKIVTKNGVYKGNIPLSTIKSITALVDANDRVTVYSTNTRYLSLGVQDTAEAISAQSDTMREFQSIGSTNLKQVDLSRCTVLEVVNVYYGSLEVIMIPTSPTLKKVNLSKSKLTSLDLSNNAALEEIILTNNPLTALGIPTNGFTSLKTMRLSATSLTLAEINGLATRINDRAGLEAGEIIIPKAIYDTMAEEQKAAFTNKNFNLSGL